MAAALDRKRDQGRDVDREAGHHPGAARRGIGEEAEIGLERVGRGRETEGEAFGEHEAIDRGGKPGMARREGGAEAQEARLVDGIARMKAMTRGERQAM